MDFAFDRPVEKLMKNLRVFLKLEDVESILSSAEKYREYLFLNEGMICATV